MVSHRNLQIGLAYVVVLAFVASGLSSFTTPDMTAVTDVNEPDSTVRTSSISTGTVPVGYWDMSTLRAGKVQNLADPLGVSDGIIHDALADPDGFVEGCYDFASVYPDTITSVECPDPNSRMQFSDGTLSAWIKSSYRGSQQVIMTRWCDGGWELGIHLGIGPQYPFYKFDSLMICIGSGTGYNWVIGDSNVDRHILDGNWHHVAVTFQGTAVKFYYDGVWDGVTMTSACSVSSPSTEPLIIGNADTLWQNPSQGSFQGGIDEVMLFDQVLDETQISGLSAMCTCIFADDFDDGTLAPWTGMGDLVYVTDVVSHSDPYSLYVYYSVGQETGTQRATSPSITTVDFSKDYSIAFWYYREFNGGRRTSALMQVIEDGRLTVTDRGGNFYAATPLGEVLVGPSAPSVWYKFEIRADPIISNYTISINDVYMGTYPFLSDSPSDKITVGSPDEPVGHIACWSYWDDFTVRNVPIAIDSDHDGISDQAEVSQGTDPYGCEKWAVLFGGGTYDGSQPNFEWQLDQAILALHALGLTDSHIMALSLTRSSTSPDSDPDSDGINDIDDISSRASMLGALQWLAANSDADDRVMIYLMDHGAESYDPSEGEYDGFLNVGPEDIYDCEVASWSAGIQCHILVFGVDCCNAGRWWYDMFVPTEGAPNRIVVMATGPTGTTFTSESGCAFSEPFFDAIQQGKSVEEAFTEADEASYLVAPKGVQDAIMKDFDEDKEVYL